MFLTLDLDRNLLVQSAGVVERMVRTEAKRSASGPVVIEVVRGGVAVSSAVPDLLLKVIAKPVGEYDGDPLAGTEDFVWTASVGAYVGAVNWITTALNEGFLVNGDPEDDKAALSLALGIAHRFDGADPWKETDNDVALTLRNNYVRDTDGTPESLPGPEQWLSLRAVRYDVAQSLSGGEKTQALANIGGAAAGGYTANRVMITDAGGVLVVSTVTSAEVAHLSGVTSGIQTQITGLQTALDTQAEALSYVCSSQTVDLATGLVLTFWMPFAFTLSAAVIYLTDAPTGGGVIVDLKEAGVSVFSTKVSIDDGEDTSVTATTPAVISDPALAAHAKMTVHIDQIGVTNKGKGLMLTLLGNRA